MIVVVAFSWVTEITILFVLALIIPILPKEAMAGLNNMDRTPPNGDPSKFDALGLCTSAPLLIGEQLVYTFDDRGGTPPDPFPGPEGVHRKLVERISFDTVEEYVIPLDVPLDVIVPALYRRTVGGVGPTLFEAVYAVALRVIPRLPFH
jgi:hypothetical protein